MRIYEVMGLLSNEGIPGITVDALKLGTGADRNRPLIKVRG